MIPMPPASSIEVTSEPSSPRSSGSFEYLGTHDTERGTSTMTTPPAPQSPASVSSVESSLPSTASNTSVAATKESIKLSAPQLRDSPPGGPDYRALGMMPVPAPPSVSWYSPVRGRAAEVKLSTRSPGPRSPAPSTPVLTEVQAANVMTPSPVAPPPVIIFQDRLSSNSPSPAVCQSQPFYGPTVVVQQPVQYSISRPRSVSRRSRSRSRSPVYIRSGYRASRSRSRSRSRRCLSRSRSPRSTRCSYSPPRRSQHIGSRGHGRRRSRSRSSRAPSRSRSRSRIHVHSRIIVSPNPPAPSSKYPEYPTTIQTPQTPPMINPDSATASSTSNSNTATPEPRINRGRVPNSPWAAGPGPSPWQNHRSWCRNGQASSGHLNGPPVSHTDGWNAWASAPYPHPQPYSPPFVPSAGVPVSGSGRIAPSTFVHVQSEYSFGHGTAFFKGAGPWVRYTPIARYHWNGEMMGPQENGQYTIDNIDDYDLDLLVSILKPENMIDPYSHVQTSQQWIQLLKVSCNIGLGKVKNLAIAKIDERNDVSAVERYSLGTQYQVPAWKEKGFKELCMRSPEDRFSKEEGRLLGVDAVLEIQEIQMEFQRKMKAVLENLNTLNF